MALKKYKANPNLLLREIAGEALLIPVGEIAMKVHGMISLSESGLFLWKKLENPCSQEELIEAILGEYDIDRDTALKDVLEFIEKMKKVGILDQVEDNG